jgi:hypothetical protein
VKRRTGRDDYNRSTVEEQKQWDLPEGAVLNKKRNKGKIRTSTERKRNTYKRQVDGDKRAQRGSRSSILPAYAAPPALQKQDSITRHAACVSTDRTVIFTHDASATRQYQGPHVADRSSTLNAITTAECYCLNAASHTALFRTRNNASRENQATRVVVVLSRNWWRRRSATDAPVHGPSRFGIWASPAFIWGVF